MTFKTLKYKVINGIKEVDQTNRQTTLYYIIRGFIKIFDGLIWLLTFGKYYSHFDYDFTMFHLNNKKQIDKVGLINVIRSK